LISHVKLKRLNVSNSRCHYPNITGLFCKRHIHVVIGGYSFVVDPGSLTTHDNKTVFRIVGENIKATFGFLIYFTSYCLPLFNHTIRGVSINKILSVIIGLIFLIVSFEHVDDYIGTRDRHRAIFFALPCPLPCSIVPCPVLRPAQNIFFRPALPSGQGRAGHIN
jgi:hypothetical protein